MTRPRHGLRARLLAVLTGATVVLLVFPSTAAAHTTLERSDPPDGGTVAVGRSTMTLWFSEAISWNASHFEINSTDGMRVASTATISEADGRGFVQVTTGPLWQATFVLKWAVLSRDDGHPSSGSVVFGAGVVPATTSLSGERVAGGWSLLIRWIDLAAIMTVIGALAVAHQVLQPLGSAAHAPLVRTRVIAVGASAIAVVTSAVTPFLRVPRFGRSLSGWFDATVDTLTGSNWGRLWLTREMLLVLVTAALITGFGRRASSSRRALNVAPDIFAALAMAGVVGVESWVGHASALPRQAALAAAMSAAHLVAAGVWAGGLAVLALCVVGVKSDDQGPRRRLVLASLTRYSPVAAISAAVLVATGLYASGRHLPGLDAIASTTYGSTVAVKLALVGVALSLAACNTLLVNERFTAIVAMRLGRRPGWAPISRLDMRRLIIGEVAAMAVAVAAAAVLASVATARELDVAAAAQTAPRSTSVDGLFLTFEVVPSGPDQNRLIVRARATVKPEPAPIEGVAVRLVGPNGTSGDLSLNAIEPGRYETETATLLAGTWQALVLVDRGGPDDVRADIKWSVRAPAVDSARDLEIVTSALAALLVAATAGTLFVLRLRAPRRSFLSTRLLENS